MEKSVIDNQDHPLESSKWIDVATLGNVNDGPILEAIRKEWG